MATTPTTTARPHGATPGEEQALRLWVVLARAYRAIEAHAAADAAQHDLTLAEFGILEALYHKGRLLLGELGQRILVSSGGITFLVDRLERRGLVAREECPDDRRARFATLTREGERLIARIFPAHAARLEQVLAGLTPAEQAEAHELLRTLGRHASELPPAEGAAPRGGRVRGTARAAAKRAR